MLLTRSSPAHDTQLSQAAGHRPPVPVGATATAADLDLGHYEYRGAPGAQRAVRPIAADLFTAIC